MMNWDAIGSIGEIIGAAAVVLSLGYLAMQIRTGNRLARAEAFRLLNSDLCSLNASFTQIEGFRRAFAEAARGASRSDIDDEDAFVLDAYLVSVTNLYEQLYRETREGIFDEKVMADFSGREWFNKPFYRESWWAYRQNLGASFVADHEARYGLGRSR